MNSQQLYAHGSLSEELLLKCFSDEKCHLGAHSTQLVIKPKELWDGTGAGTLSALLLL